MCYPIATETVLEGLDYCPLPHYFIKGLGPGFSGKYQIGHGGSEGVEGMVLEGPQKKNDSRAPCTHRGGHCRCFLPDLAEFMIRCCIGPGYQKLKCKKYQQGVPAGLSVFTPDRPGLSRRFTAVIEVKDLVCLLAPNRKVALNYSVYSDVMMRSYVDIPLVVMALCAV